MGAIDFDGDSTSSACGTTAASPSLMLGHSDPGAPPQSVNALLDGNAAARKIISADAGLPLTDFAGASAARAAALECVSPRPSAFLAAANVRAMSPCFSATFA